MQISHNHYVQIGDTTIHIHQAPAPRKLVLPGQLGNVLEQMPHCLNRLEKHLNAMGASIAARQATPSCS
jgi:hypothetical protein